MKTFHVTEGKVCLEACSLKDALWIHFRNAERLFDMVFDVNDSSNHWSLSLALVIVS